MNFLALENSSARLAVNVLRNERGHVSVNVNKLLGSIGVQSMWNGCISDGTSHFSRVRHGDALVEISVSIGSFSIKIWRTSFGLRLPFSAPTAELHVESQGAASDVSAAQFHVNTAGFWTSRLGLK